MRNAGLLVACLASVLLLASMEVRATTEDFDLPLVDMDGDGDIDADDLASLEQQRMHSELERVGELPWWVVDEKEYAAYTANGGTRLLEQAAVKEVEEVDEKQLLESLAEELKNQQKKKHRQTQARTSSIIVTEGYCLPPPRRLFKARSTCKTRTQRCGGAYGSCCAGLICKRKSDGVRCRSTCKGDGRECNTGSTCCSQQCVLCKNGCQGRCGLGIESPKDNVQTFYYPWYSNIITDGKYRHWAIDSRPEGGVFAPEFKDLPTNYYPHLGAYSSSSQETLNTHFEWLTRAGIGTIIVSWWGAGSYEDSTIWRILNTADDYGLKVGFYIEPYKGGYINDPLSNITTSQTRTPYTASDDVKYIIDTYGCHRAMYRRRGRPVFMFFAARTYDSGDQTEWKTVWDALHADPKYNPVVIAHDVNLDSRIIKGGWDGGHDYGTEAAFGTSSSWKTLATNYAAASKILYFTVSPGFDNSRSRGSTKPIISRQDGLLYHTFWLRAIDKRTSQNPVIITSFNEWHEGTQIEVVDPTTFPPYLFKGENRSGYTYQDYEGAWGLNGTAASFAYIDQTKIFSDLFLAKTG